MFTGIIRGLGTVVAIEDRDKFRVVTIDAGGLVENPKVGASMSVSGVCLTITAIDTSTRSGQAGTMLTFDVMEETLRKTTAGELAMGDEVNIEPSMQVGDELGGHFVLGHVDGVGEVVHKAQDGENTRMRFRVPDALARFIVDKGSIAIDGISLTVCDPSSFRHPEPVEGSHCEFDVWLLPLTLQRTTLGQKGVGAKVNIEADYLLKAVLRNR